MSLISLFSFISLHDIRWCYWISHLCRVSGGVVFVLELAFWLHTLLPSVQRRFSIALWKRPKVVLSYQHQKFGTLLLSGLAGGAFSHCISLLLSNIESIQRANLSFAPLGVAELTSACDFKTMCIPDEINIFLLCITVVLLDRGKPCYLQWISKKKKPFYLS